jgi:hypothetical protein
MRRWWVTTIGRTRLVIEAVDIRPGQAHAQVALADAELDELVDSLRPAAYPEIGVAYPADANGVGTAYRYDEPVPPPPPKVCEALPGRPDLVMCREV